jgi:hypothetical protein
VRNFILSERTETSSESKFTLSERTEIFNEGKLLFSEHSESIFEDKMYCAKLYERLKFFACELRELTQKFSCVNSRNSHT